ncbi:partner and localizer of BRCA2 isoform X1 [Lethenteron reissneri]|uniref:partner and localizer of BRCA2 isoform X1 n=1 Tax=Lethenteron reissneri TaxID=7753 RepID=UPI002AB7046C|nr:partner and localizer of BRCA2 isoform X1 [Lethenteron reissneri]
MERCCRGYKDADDKNYTASMDSAEAKKMKISAEEKEKLKQRLALLKKQYIKVQQKLERVEKIDRVRSHVRMTIAEQNHLLREGNREEVGLDDGNYHIYNENQIPSAVGFPKKYQEKVAIVGFKSQPKVITLHNIPESCARKVSEPLTEPRLEHVLGEANTDSFSQSEARTGRELGNVTQCDQQTNMDERNVRISKALTEQRTTDGTCWSEVEHGWTQRSQKQGNTFRIQAPQGSKHDIPKSSTSSEISNRVLEGGKCYLQKKFYTKQTMSDFPCVAKSSQHNKPSDYNFSSSNRRCSRSSLRSQRAEREVDSIHALTSSKNYDPHSDERLPELNETSSLLFISNISAIHPVHEYSRSNIQSPEVSGWQSIQDTAKLNQYARDLKDVDAIQEVIGIENVSSISRERLAVDNKPTEKMNNEAAVKHYEETALENSDTPELDINEEDCIAQGGTCTPSDLKASGCQSEKCTAIEHKIQCSDIPGSIVKKKENYLPQTQQSETCREANADEQRCATEVHGTEPGTSHTLVNGLPFPVEYYVRTTRGMASRRSEVDLQAVINNHLKTRSCEGGKGASRARISRRKKNALSQSEENTSPETQLLFESSNSTASSEKSVSCLPVTRESQPQLVEVSGLKSVIFNEGISQTSVDTPVVARECLTDTEVDCNTGVLKRRVLSIRRRGRVKGNQNGSKVCWRYKSIENSGIQSLPSTVTDEGVGASMYENITAPLKVRDITKDILASGCHDLNGISIHKECSDVGPEFATARDSENQSEDLIPDTQCSTWSNAPPLRSSSLRIGSDTRKQGSPAATAQGQEEQGPTDFEGADISSFSQDLTFSLGLMLSCLQTKSRGRRRVVDEFSLPDEFDELKRLHAHTELNTGTLTNPRITADEGAEKVKVGAALGVPCEEKCSVTREDNNVAPQEDKRFEKANASCPDDNVMDKSQKLGCGDAKAQLSTTVILSTPVESGQVQLDQMPALSPPRLSVGFSPPSLHLSQVCGLSQTSGLVKQLNSDPKYDDVNGECAPNRQVNKVKGFTHSEVNVANPCKGELPPAAVAAAAPVCHEGQPPMRDGAELFSQCSGAELQGWEHQEFVRPETVLIHPSQLDNTAAVAQMSPHELNVHRDQADSSAPLVTDDENNPMDVTQGAPKQQFHWQLDLMATIQCSASGSIEALCSAFWELQGHPCRCLIVAQKGLVSLWAEHWEDGQWQEIHTWVLTDGAEVSKLVLIQDSQSPRLVAVAGNVRILHVVGGSAVVSQPLIGETVGAVVALRWRRVVCVTWRRLVQTLTMLSFDEQNGSHCASHLSTPDDDIITLSDVSGEDEALIGSTASKDLIIWNVKSGHIICCISLTFLGPCSLCRRAVSDSGLVFAVLSPMDEISKEEPSAFENVACTLAAINPSSRRACTAAHYQLPSGHTAGFVCGVLGGGTLAAAFTSGALAVWDVCSGKLAAVWDPPGSGQRWALLDWATMSHNQPGSSPCHMALLENVQGSVKVFKCGPL